MQDMGSFPMVYGKKNLSLPPLVRIGISIYEMNLGEPTLIYVHTCFGSPEKSKSKSLHKGF